MRLVGRVWRGWFPAAFLVLLLALPFGEVELPVPHSHHGGDAFATSASLHLVPEHPHFTTVLVDWTAIAVQRSDHDWRPRSTVPRAIAPAVDALAASDPIPGIVSVRGPPGRALSGYGRDTLLRCCIDRR